MAFTKLYKIAEYKLLLLLIFIMPFSVFVSQNANSETNTNTQETLNEEPSPKKGVSIKEYSTGTVYKELAPTTSAPKKALNATNEDDPVLPGDPGQGLPVGDGLIFMLVVSLAYYLIKKYTFKKET